MYIFLKTKKNVYFNSLLTFKINFIFQKIKIICKNWLLLCILFQFNKMQAQPKEKGNFFKTELVELIKLDSHFKLDIRYATSNNFVGKPVYNQARAFLQKPATLALVNVQKKLMLQGYGLLIFDGYRPWSITKLFWESVAGYNRKFVANPKKGSKHNRGCAVDLSLYDLKSGKEIIMPSSYDEFSERAYPTYTGGTVQETAMRDLLIKTMEENNFKVEGNEWWHFNFNGWEKYKITNIPFEKL